MNQIHLLYDVVILGAGPGGIPAAIAAARRGCKVLLVERNDYLGGLAVSGLPWLGFLDGHGRNVVGGIPQEFIDRLVSLNASFGHCRCPVHTSITVIQPEIFKIVAFEMCKRENIDILLHSELLDVRIDNNEISSITILGKGKNVSVGAKIFIDASGDGELAFKAGANFIVGQSETGNMQPSSLIFTLENVDLDKTLLYLEKIPEAFELPNTYNSKYTIEYFKNTPGYALTGFANLLNIAVQNGEYSGIRSRFVYCVSPNKGQVFINTTRVLGIDATDPFSFSKGSAEAHMQILELLNLAQKYFPGFENCYLSSISPVLGVRETRHFECIDILRDSIVLNGEIPIDSIAIGSYPVDIHRSNDAETEITTLKEPYGIPYGSIVNSNINNLLMSGRAISAETKAYGSCRVIGTCMAISEAAGTAAALCIERKFLPRDIPIDLIKNELEKGGAIIGFEKLCL